MTITGRRALFPVGNGLRGAKKEGVAHISSIFWIAGYITAYNLHKPDVYSILGNADMESAQLWMDKYCQENPLNKLADGMEILTIELWPNRKRTADD